MSPRVFNGWTPTFVTDHEYDEAGRLVRTVTRQLESEWDDTSRGLAEGLAVYRAQVHTGGCGLHPAILAEPDVYKFTYARENCPACATAAVHRRVVGEEDEKYDKAHPNMPVRVVRPYDGRQIFMRPVVPDVEGASAHE